MPDITRVFRALHFPRRRREVVSAVDATPINVQPGEMLYDEAANKLYAGREDTTAVQIGGGGGVTDPRWDLFLPAAPTGLTVTAGNAQASLTWTAPTVLAQTPITDYSVQYSTDGGSTWTTFTAAASTATSATVTGLTNGTAYVFRVAAINGIGTGPYTAASSSVTPIAGTPPNAPTSLTATAGNAQIALSWTAPSAPGTFAITGYTVEYTPSGGSAQTVSTGSTGTSYTLTGLTNGTAYTVRVAAVSAAGTGTYTAASSAVTPSAASLTVSPSSGTADSGTAYSWSGAGTVASPLETNDAASPNGIVWIFAGGANTYDLWQFTCGVSGTLTFELGAGFDNDGVAERPFFDRYLRNGVQSTTFVGGTTNLGDHYIRRSISVSAGDVIRLGRASPSFSFASSEILKGKIRLWIS
jgi:hypothetical protein